MKRNRWTGEQNWNVNNRLSVWSRCIRAKTFFFAMCFCDAWLWMGMGMDPVPASLPAICYHLPISRIKVANWSMKSPRHIHWHCTDINHGKSWLHLPRPSIFRRFKQTKNSTTEKKNALNRMKNLTTEKKGKKSKLTRENLTRKKWKNKK